MTTRDITEAEALKAIEQAGWEPEEIDFPILDNLDFRAVQASFSTPWCSSWSEVLDYIRGRKEK